MTVRFIPASAGNTISEIPAPALPPVYPRSRGEHEKIQRGRKCECGLSPLARGTHIRCPCFRMLHRFIPAGAGNTSPHPAAATGRPVYPCWPGEHSRSRMRISTRAGLYPLARGTLEPTNQPSPSGRFIPAGAGNTFNSGEITLRVTVYPRWRGEHGWRLYLWRVNSGLSPLARGTHRSITDVTASDRFIPAGAGNTIAYVDCASMATVYPRWRGEHRGRVQPFSVRPGLSPLPRGTQQAENRKMSHARFIHAAAGNTALRSAHLTHQSVYPRCRGEHNRYRKVIRSQNGLPPLARGTPGHENASAG